MTNVRRVHFGMAVPLLALFDLACSDEGINAGSGKTCTLGGQTHKPGETFKWDCNTCTCMADGTALCTDMACLGTGGQAVLGGAGGSGGLVGTGVSGTGGAVGTGGATAGGAIGTGGATLLADAGSPGTCSANGRTYQIGERLKVDCNTCTCTASGLSCTEMACGPDGGADVLPVDAGPAPDGIVACTFNGTTLLPGQSVFDGCNTCTCGNDGRMMCTARACPEPDAALAADTATPACTLSSNLTFGHDGGMVIYQDTNRLTSSTFSITRTSMRGVGPDGATASTCSPKLPACGASGVVNVATINADLADAEVQVAFQSAQSSGTLYGTDPRPADGTVYSIALDDGRRVLVGGQCASPTMSSCRTIPAGLLRLTNDLMSLAAAMAADPACAGL